jgi:hypothetical protein
VWLHKFFTRCKGERGNHNHSARPDDEQGCSFGGWESPRRQHVTATIDATVQVRDSIILFPCFAEVSNEGARSSPDGGPGGSDRLKKECINERESINAKNTADMWPIETRLGLGWPHLSRFDILPSLMKHSQTFWVDQAGDAAINGFRLSIRNMRWSDDTILQKGCHRSSKIRSPPAHRCSMQ